MNKLYKKILNEVFSVMDFDSWDNTEQTFKEDISENLSSVKFIYKKYDFTGIINVNLLKIVNKSWPQSLEYKDKFFCDGKRLDLISSPPNGGSIYRCKSFQAELYKEYIITIENLEDIKEARSMFAQSDLNKILGNWDTSKITTFGFMFWGCRNLESVPLLDLSSLRNEAILGMFTDCNRLDEQTKDAWKLNPSDGGTVFHKKLGYE